MEWTGNQQLWFLLQSCGVGGVVGVLFDVLTGWGRASVKRYMVYLLDAVFGLLAALITFFGGLVITDGRMHPLLFAGVLMGMLAEHFLIGRFISRLIRHSVRALRRVSLFFRSSAASFEQRLVQIGRRNREQRETRDKNPKKVQKNRYFFKKKT